MTATAHSIDATKSFIKVSEIWVPTKDRLALEHGQGLYGARYAFREVSARTRFAPGEGLPGKAWKERRPVVLKNLDVPFFKRAAPARAAGLTCAIALPIFAGEFLQAVAVFFCGDDDKHVGAIELWSNDPAESPDMGLCDGYYGTAEVFEKDSRAIKFRRGYGLPGLVWERQLPVFMDDLGKSQHFLRARSAVKVGINRGLGLPCSAGDGRTYVLTFLSALGTPIARRFEVWAPVGGPGAGGSSPHAGGGGELRFVEGRCESTPELARDYMDVRIRRGEGILGRVALTGIPAASTDLTAPEIPASVREARMESVVALPILANGALRAVVAWYL